MSLPVLEIELIQSYCNGDLHLRIFVLDDLSVIPLNLDSLERDLEEIRLLGFKHNLGVHANGVPLAKLLGNIQMSVVNLEVRYREADICQFVAEMTGNHFSKDDVLNLIDSTSCDIIPATDINWYVKIVLTIFFVSYNELGLVYTRFESVRFCKVCILPEIDDVAAGIGIFFHLFERPMHKVMAAYCTTIAGTDSRMPLFIENKVTILVFDGPLIPPVVDLVVLFPSVFADKLVKNNEVIASFLVNPEDFRHTVAPCWVSQCVQRQISIENIIGDIDVVDWVSVSRSFRSILFFPNRSRVLV